MLASEATGQFSPASCSPKASDAVFRAGGHHAPRLPSRQLVAEAGAASRYTNGVYALRLKMASISTVACMGSDPIPTADRA